MGRFRQLTGLGQGDVTTVTLTACGQGRYLVAHPRDLQHDSACLSQRSSAGALSDRLSIECQEGGPLPGALPGAGWGMPARRDDVAVPGKGGDVGCWVRMNPRVRRWLLVAAGGAHLGVTARMLPFERAMRAGGGHGIVAFEVAGTPERARQLLDAWGPTGRAAARRSLRWDYGYLATYAVFLAAACAGAARRLGRRGWPAAAAVGPTVAWALVLAGGCDAVENAALLAALRHGPHQPLPALARAAALAKFAVLGPALAYLVLAALLPRRRADVLAASSEGF